jgi:hypothetical protein
MGMTSGIQTMGTYTGTTGDAIDSILALIPDADTRESPNPRNYGSMLDEMSPLAAAQIRVELEALKGVLDAGGDDTAYGQYTVTAGDATANLVNITTGLDDTSLANIAVTVSRAGSIVTSDAVITEPSAGVIRVADGSTYNTTAGDIITWFAIDPSA